MGQPQGRSRHHNNKLRQKKSFRSKRRTKDVDQTRRDMLDPVIVQKIAETPADGDLPGMGRFYCISCNRHMIDDHAMKAHLRSKVHKRKIKKLQDEPYSIKEAEEAAGMGNYSARTDVVAKAVLNAAVSTACVNATLVVTDAVTDAAPAMTE